MRGGDVRSEALFSYLSCAARVPLDHPLRPIQKIVDQALDALTGEFEKLYATLGTAVDSAGETASRAAVAGVLFGALGAAADGAARLQFVVPLVCRAVAGRGGVGCHGVYQEPRAADRRRHRRAVHGGGAGTRAGQGAAVGRPLLGGRHLDRGVGEHEELSPEGRQRRAGRRRAATASGTFTARSAATRPTPRPPTP